MIQYNEEILEPILIYLNKRQIKRLDRTLEKIWYINDMREEIEKQKVNENNNNNQNKKL